MLIAAIDQSVHDAIIFETDIESYQRRATAIGAFGSSLSAKATRCALADASRVAVGEAASSTQAKPQAGVVLVSAAQTPTAMN